MTANPRQLHPLHARVAELEQRATRHDAMAAKIDEMYDAWTKLKTINWFAVKLFGWGAGGLSLVAVTLTIVTSAAKLTGH